MSRSVPLVRSEGMPQQTATIMVGFFVSSEDSNPKWRTTRWYQLLCYTSHLLRSGYVRNHWAESRNRTHAPCSIKVWLYHWAISANFIRVWVSNPTYTPYMFPLFSETMLLEYVEHLWDLNPSTPTSCRQLYPLSLKCSFPQRRLVVKPNFAPLQFGGVTLVKRAGLEPTIAGSPSTFTN